jgi:hypothetical protein
MPVVILGELAVSISEYNRAVLPAADEKRFVPGAGASATGRSSTSEFHAPHSGQRPSHFCDCDPHSWHTKTVLDIFTANVGTGQSSTGGRNRVPAEN